LKSWAAREIDRIREREAVREVILAAAAKYIESKTDLAVFRDAHYWYKKDVDLASLTPVKAVYATIVSGLYFQVRDVTVCREIQKGNRSVVCFSGNTLDDSVLVVLQVFENGKGRYEVSVSGPSDKVVRDRDSELKRQWRSLVNGVAASVFVNGLTLRKRDE